jgi:hypothetical protein
MVPTNPLVLSVARLKEQVRQFQIQNASLKEFLSNMNVGSIPEAEKAVDELRELIRGLRRQTKHERGKVRRQQKSSKLASAERRAKVRQLKRALRAQQRQITALKQKQQDEHLSHQSEVTALKRTIADLKHEQETQILETENQKKRYLTEYEKSRVELLNQISAAESQLDESSVRLQELERDSRYWRRVSNSLRKENEKQESKIQNLQSVQVRSLAQFEADKEAVILQSQHVIAALKDRNRQLRGAIRELTFSAEQSQQEKRDLLNKVSGLEHQHRADRQELDSKNEEILREKQLLEAKSRAFALQIETKYQTMSEDLKAKCRAEKQKLMGLIVKNFKDFFDERQPITDEGFGAVVQKAAFEYQRLKSDDAAVRRLLLIGPVECVEDAVAKLLLSLRCRC